MRFDPDDVSGLLPEWQSESQITLAPAESLLWARFAAWLRPGLYDRRLASGATVHAETPLALHAERLTSVRERESVARSLRRCIDGITSRLHSQRPVTARGMAAVRLLLGDGGGPLYRYGRGDLRERLTAAFGSL